MTKNTLCNNLYRLKFFGKIKNLKSEPIKQESRCTAMEYGILGMKFDGYLKVGLKRLNFYFLGN